MVSLTAANTKRILGVSVACVKLVLLSYNDAEVSGCNTLWVDA